MLVVKIKFKLDRSPSSSRQLLKNNHGAAGVCVPIWCVPPISPGWFHRHLSSGAGQIGVCVSVCVWGNFVILLDSYILDRTYDSSMLIYCTILSY